MEVWEWAEGHVVLSPRLSRFPGPLSLTHTPYMRGEWSPLWAYRRYQHIDNIWAAQTGKTMMLAITVLYDTEVDPGPGMIVYPDKVTAQRRSRRYLMPIIESSIPQLIPDASECFQILEYNLVPCSWVLAWAGSPSVLAGEPVKHLKLDEEAKFQGHTEAEADPKRLAMRRLISFGEFANAFSCTTPSLAHHPGWRDWKGSTQCQYQVQCPRCGTWQTMYFSREDRRWFEPESGDAWEGGIRWDRDPALTLEQRIASAYYLCENQACAMHWSSALRDELVAKGRWVARNPKAGKYASHLASWNAKWVKFSEVIERWLASYKDENARHDFLNSDCAVPYEVMGKQADSNELRKHILKGYHCNTIHEDVAAVVLTADIHDDHIRYRVRGWAPDLTSWGIEEGQMPPYFAALDNLLGSRTYRGPDGAPVPIHYAIVDSGFRTDEVYQLCLRWAGRVWPCRGVSYLRELVQYSRQYVQSDPQRGCPLGGAMVLINANDARWKDLLFARWEVQPGASGAWYVEEEASKEYFEQLTGETKVEEKTPSGHPKFVWRQTHDNHALDCEKMQMIATMAFQIAALRPPRAKQVQGPQRDNVNPWTGRDIGQS